VGFSYRGFFSKTRITEDLSKNFSASCDGVFQVFENEHSGSLAEDEAFAFAIVRS